VLGNEHPGRVRGVGDGVCPTQLFGTRFPRFGGSWSSNGMTEPSRVTHLESEVVELKSKLDAKDAKMKKIEMLLAQLLVNASMPVPSDLVTDPSDIVSYSS
jgi:hypothetical protein